jgi:hypothetical protein
VEIVVTASCVGPMDPSYHGGGAAGGSADDHGQMWVRGPRVVCVDPRLWGLVSARVFVAAPCFGGLGVGLGEGFGSGPMRRRRWIL